jgi:acyl carrier protein
MSREEIFSVLKENIVNVIEGTQDITIKESDSMKDYGADSLEMVEVVSRSMKQLKTKVRRTELSKAANLSDLIDMFEAAANQ